ncbi:MAG: outer membrane protein assembly factor BamD, partial [Alphaproteobacteria bacterium]|nr:outer membrane protein assembly factor BamD [Alphaproteobacteria bacterium]
VKMKKYYAALGAFLLLTACSNKVDLEAMSAEEIYNYAMDEMEKTRYAKAETAFEALETDHPYSQWAVRAKLMSAYAYYKDEKYDEAVMAVDRFIKYHPGNKDVPYALYLKGMCYYDQISAADKDQGNTQKAAETFALLMVMYPESEYAKDAAGKMNLTEDYKAGQEMIVGRYYLHEGNYLSALNRFNVVLENYQKTIQIEEALYREVEIYAIFGLNNYANGYFKILQKNYPDGKWTAKAEKIMKKIGVEVQPSKKVAKPKEEQPQKVEEESKGWFSGWFGGDDEAEEVKSETAEEATEAKEENKGWFSGWFGGDDEDKAEKAKAETTEQVEVVKEENKGWFSGWFGGSKDKAETAPAVVEQKAAPVVQAKDAATIADEEKQAETLEKMVSKTNNSEKDIGNDNASWFDEWRNGNKAEEAKPVTERESWFDGWFGGNKDKAEEVKADTAKKVESVKKESQKAADAGKAKAAQSAKAVKTDNEESLEQVRQELQKIVDTDDADAEEAVEPKERRSGWFSGWFHGGSEISDDMAKSKKAADEAINESLDKAREESKNAVDTAEELQESAEDTAKPEEKKGGWFSGLFSGGTVMSDDNAE